MNAPPRRKRLEKRELSMPRTLEPYQMIERSIIKKYRDELWKPFVYAAKKYELIQAGDKIAVCISGGKDSMLMAKLMQELHRHSDVPFELVFLVMDPGYNAINRQRIESNAALLHIPQANVACVGDHANDISMLTWAGMAFAPANALPEVRALPCVRTLPDCREDAIAALIAVLDEKF